MTMSDTNKFAVFKKAVGRRICCLSFLWIIISFFVPGLILYQEYSHKEQYPKVWWWRQQSGDEKRSKRHPQRNSVIAKLKQQNKLNVLTAPHNIWSFTLAKGSFCEDAKQTRSKFPVTSQPLTKSDPALWVWDAALTDSGTIVSVLLLDRSDCEFNVALWTNTLRRLGQPTNATVLITSPNSGTDSKLVGGYAMCRYYNHRAQLLTVVQSLQIIRGMIVRCPVPLEIRGRSGVHLKLQRNSASQRATQRGLASTNSGQSMSRMFPFCPLYTTESATSIIHRQTHEKENKLQEIQGLLHGHAKGNFTRDYDLYRNYYQKKYNISKGTVPSSENTGEASNTAPMDHLSGHDSRSGIIADHAEAGVYSGSRRLSSLDVIPITKSKSSGAKTQAIKTIKAGGGIGYAGPEASGMSAPRAGSAHDSAEAFAASHADLTRPSSLAVGTQSVMHITDHSTRHTNIPGFRGNYNVSVCAVSTSAKKDMIIEWIEHHRLQGVQHFFIYDALASSIAKPSDEVGRSAMYAQDGSVMNASTSTRGANLRGNGGIASGSAYASNAKSIRRTRKLSGSPNRNQEPEKYESFHGVGGDDDDDDGYEYEEFMGETQQSSTSGSSKTSSPNQNSNKDRPPGVHASTHTHTKGAEAENVRPKHGLRAVLWDYIGLGVVTLVPWPYSGCGYRGAACPDVSKSSSSSSSSSLSPYPESNQIPSDLMNLPADVFPPSLSFMALQSCYLRFRGHTKWMALLETNEFVAIDNQQQLENHKPASDIHGIVEGLSEHYENMAAVEMPASGRIPCADDMLAEAPSTSEAAPASSDVQAEVFTPHFHDGNKLKNRKQKARQRARKKSQMTDRFGIGNSIGASMETSGHGDVGEIPPAPGRRMQARDSDGYNDTDSHIDASNAYTRDTQGLSLKDWGEDRSLRPPRVGNDEVFGRMQWLPSSASRLIVRCDFVVMVSDYNDLVLVEIPTLPSETDLQYAKSKEGREHGHRNNDTSTHTTQTSNVTVVDHNAILHGKDYMKHMPMKKDRSDTKIIRMRAEHVEGREADHAQYTVARLDRSVGEIMHFRSTADMSPCGEMRESLKMSTLFHTDADRSSLAEYIALHTLTAPSPSSSSSGRGVIDAAKMWDEFVCTRTHKVDKSKLSDEYFEKLSDYFISAYEGAVLTV